MSNKTENGLDILFYIVKFLRLSSYPRRAMVAMVDKPSHDLAPCDTSYK